MVRGCVVCCVCHGKFVLPGHKQAAHDLYLKIRARGASGLLVSFSRVFLLE